MTCFLNLYRPIHRPAENGSNFVQYLVESTPLSEYMVPGTWYLGRELQSKLFTSYEIVASSFSDQAAADVV